MARLIFCVGSALAPSVEDSFFVIDMSWRLPTKIREARRPSGHSIDIDDALAKQHFGRLLNGVKPRSRVVVHAFPQTESDANYILGLLKEGYTARLIVSGSVEKKFKEFLRARFRKSVVFVSRKKKKGKKVDLTKVIRKLSG